MIDDVRFENWINQSLVKTDQTLEYIRKGLNENNDDNSRKEHLKQAILELGLAQSFLETLLRSMKNNKHETETR